MKLEVNVGLVERGITYVITSLLFVRGYSAASLQQKEPDQPTTLLWFIDGYAPRPISTQDNIQYLVILFVSFGLAALVVRKKPSRRLGVAGAMLLLVAALSSVVLGSGILSIPAVAYEFIFFPVLFVGLWFLAVAPFPGLHTLAEGVARWLRPAFVPASLAAIVIAGIGELTPLAAVDNESARDLGTFVLWVVVLGVFMAGAVLYTTARH